MPIQINTAVKGKEYPPYPGTVERGKIKEFARAIGDLSPFYLDHQGAQAGPLGDIIPTPTFPPPRPRRGGKEQGGPPPPPAPPPPPSWGPGAPRPGRWGTSSPRPPSPSPS